MTTTPTSPPSVEQIMAGMSAGLGGNAIPPIIQLATVMPDMPDMLRQAKDSGFAKPKQGGALASRHRRGPSGRSR